MAMTLRWKMRLGAVFVVVLASAWLVVPVIRYYEPTSRNVSVTVTSEPFIGSDTLNYIWIGEVYRSCPVTLERRIVDSLGVETRWAPEDRNALPVEYLGETELPISVVMPDQIAVGPAIYQVTETPKCDWLQRLFPIRHNYPPVHFTVTR